MPDYTVLKTRQRVERTTYPQNLSLRIHRALSWLNKSEQCDDDDSKFIFLWIAFNSAYAQEFEQRDSYGEQGLYGEFLKKLVECDKNNQLHELVWNEYSNAIRVILDNEFILQAYWNFHAGRIDEESWKEERFKAKVAANKALSNNDTAKVLSIVFSRLYTLRNQLIHGGATYLSSANRQQIKDCSSILEKLVPLIIEVMMDSADQVWGDAVYPLISDS
ncbi:HEPN domain-containing protein [Vibrio hangzhouensis]|uniref:Uncharacterized protein n=1 Tax=Vibrio hangzhouensis TaxID=462991 RepID=A0A1H5Y6K1_9VIBR|nr:HEPN domain-containing protein [Vibrio hangzhouensis]SEG19415.1 hypothetical protein SAMN04488244_108154 [Vibrio hangzhouensis]